MCGCGKEGQLGIGIAEQVYTPTRVLSQVTQVACGEKHTLILTTSGSLLTCGSNSMHQLGLTKK